MTARADPKMEPGAAIIEIVIGAARVRLPPGIDVATLQMRAARCEGAT